MQSSASNPKCQVVHHRSSAAYSITMRIRLPNEPGSFSHVLQYFAQSGASMGEIDIVSSDFDYKVRQVTVDCRDEEHSHQLIEGLKKLDRVTLLHWQDDTFALHEGGKIEVMPKAKLASPDVLSRAYTPGVARVCTRIAEHPEDVYRFTIKQNMVAIVSDGSAVLGLGNIGPRAALPVMEGKAMLFKQFGNIDAFPICLETQDVDEIVKTVKLISPVFGGINLEDISSPRCFQVEERLKQELEIPVFHDDQHGTAVVVLAGVLNALKVVGKKIENVRGIVCGFGAGGVACTLMLQKAGLKNIVPFDSHGAIHRGRKEGMNSIKEKLIADLNPDNFKGSLSEALRGADFFLGVSRPHQVTTADVSAMAKGSIVFALANPVPEIMPEEARGVATVVATGRSDYPNQINNVLCFPGLFRGALDCRARQITPNMKLAAAMAIASCVKESELGPDRIIPNIFDPCVLPSVSSAVCEAARKDGVARAPVAVQGG